MFFGAESGLIANFSLSVRKVARHLNYSSALDHILGLADFERPKKTPQQSEYHLHRIEMMLQKLGNPHLNIPTVHVAGTKGKGSTAAIVASILTAQGYKTGLYTSPHLHTFRERIKIGHINISEAHFTALIEELWPLVKWITEKGGYGEPTTFEMLTCMALFHFKRVEADFQVIEVGMGGRLDTTNVVKPEVCVLTSISLDHTEILGSTLEQIAREKAGIIKPGAVAVVAPQRQEAMGVFRQVCAEKGVKLVSVAESVSWQKVGHTFEGQNFDVQTSGRKTYHLWTPLLGGHQLENSCTALAAVEALMDKGHKVSDKSIRKGIKEVRWPGRLQVLKHNGKTVVVDGAHNPYSVRMLVEGIKDYFQFKNVIALFGVLGGHNLDEMAQELAALSRKALAVRSRHPRAASTDSVEQALTKAGIEVIREFSDVGQALSFSVDMAMEGDLILGTGSLFVAAEVIEAMEGQRPELYPALGSSSQPMKRT